VAQRVHDLRNEFLVIAACAEQIAELVPGGIGQQRLAELMRHAEEGELVSRQVLTSRPALRDRRLLNLNHVIMNAWTTFAAVIGHRRVQLHLAGEPLRVVARIAEIERIVLNLVLNARDAVTGDGVVTIETAIERDAAADGEAGPRNSARLTVSDTGPGVPLHVQPRIFEPLFTTRDSGTGLGLSSVLYTARQLRGSVSVQSRRGDTRVTVLLPLAEAAPPIS
jgi:signal transduction histidine kinase